MIDSDFRRRYWESEPLRPDDQRDDYQRDKARVIHSSAFRRLQAKTQVMGVGEGDFHRTRLTHSIEASQIGEGLLGSLMRRSKEKDFYDWLPPADLMAAACLAHDLGHPPFGHGGERALHARMAEFGGFEGNGQTLRIITRLEKYKLGKGMNPTRRLILALLKYPVPYSDFDKANFLNKPPKCYFDTEEEVVRWAFGPPFVGDEVARFRMGGIKNGKPRNRTLDSSIMEVADDIAYAVHDLEDIVARHMVRSEEVVAVLKPVFDNFGPKIGVGEKSVCLSEFENDLFSDSFSRKTLIGKAVNLFVTSSQIFQRNEYSHPLLKYYIAFEEPVARLLEALKEATFQLVVGRAEVQQLERRGRRIVERLFDELIQAPEELIPRATWKIYDDDDKEERRVCDYIAGMTDNYAQRIYERLFVPGRGSSHEEL